MREQILRSALSIPSNIAEGCERGTDKDTIRFLHIAKGSCAELRTQLYLSAKMKLIGNHQVQEHIETSKKISAKLQNLIKSFQRNT